MTPNSDKNKRTLYGRRQGRPLRAAQRRLLADVLPALSVDNAGRVDDAGQLFDPRPSKVWLEIGFGAGEHLAAQAAAHPEIGFIGCEPFVNGVARLLQAIEKVPLENIRIFTDDARLFLKSLPDASIDRCFILFPDPWPKRRHHRRRIVAPGTLDEIARVLADGAALRLASDHREYIRWMLFHTIGHGSFEWCAQRPADWRERPEDWPATRYEEKAAQRGSDSVYLQFCRRPRS